MRRAKTAAAFSCYSTLREIRSKNPSIPSGSCLSCGHVHFRPRICNGRDYFGAICDCDTFIERRELGLTRGL